MDSAFRQLAHEPIDFIAPSGGVVSKRPVIIGGICVIPQISALVGATFPGVITGVHIVNKQTGFTAAVGAQALYDATTDHRLESAGPTAIGVYMSAAASDDTTARIMLTPEAIIGARIVGTAIGGTITEEVEVVPPLAAGTKTGVWIAPYAGSVSALAYFTGGKPGSAAGTVLLTVKRLVDGLTMISTANVNAEALTEDAWTALTLSVTPADLVLAAGDSIEFKFVADNADALPGEGVTFRVSFLRT